MRAALQPTPAEWRALELEAYRRSLIEFVRDAWHIVEPAQPFVHGWHLDAIAEHLQAITDGKLTRLLINVPPGTMKSLLTAVFWPAWEWGPRSLPSTRVLATSHNDRLATRDNLKCRRLVQSAWFQDRWPLRMVSDQNAKTKFENDKTGFREAMPFTSLTGSRGDRVIIDDPHSVDGAKSDAERNSVIDTFTESVPTRLNNPKSSAIIVVMQRLHEQDVSGVIVARNLGYEHLMLPMEFERARACSTSIGFRDPRTTEGELLFPKRFPREVVERDKAVMGSYTTAGQFQQRPAPREGGLFKRAWFPVVDAVPATHRRVRRWDFAGTEQIGSGDPDWTVGLRMCESGGVFYIEDVQRDRVSPAGVERMLVATAQQDGQGIPVRIPQDPGAAGKSNAAHQIRLLAGWDVRAEPETGSKEVRAGPLSAQAEAGNVRLVRGAWNEAFLDEVTVFPNGAHDDQVDAASGAFASLLSVSTYNPGAFL